MSFLFFAVSDAISYVVKTVTDVIINTIYETGEIGDTFTDRIDEMLMDPKYGKPGSLILMGAGKKIPNIGKHYYSLQPIKDSSYSRWVGLEKVSNGQKPANYRIWRIRGFDYSENITKFHERILKVEEGSISYYIIGIKNMESYLVLTSRILHEPWKVQVEICDRIIRNYRSTLQRSTRVLLWGEPGLGKTEMGCFLKQKMDATYPNTNCQLICGVDPSQLCMDIRTLILNKTSKNAPVILMIDEIEKYFQKVYQDDPMYITGTQHTRNVDTFHTMLDAIASTRYVVFIATSNVNPVDLRNVTLGEAMKVKEADRTAAHTVSAYTTFLRPGRFNSFMRLYRQGDTTTYQYTANVSEAAATNIQTNSINYTPT